MQSSGGVAHAVAAQPDTEQQAAHPMPVSFRAAIDLFAAEKEAIVAGHLFNAVHLVRFEPGTIEFRAAQSAPNNLAATVGKRLTEWTGKRWMVSLATEGGAPTLAQQEAAGRDQTMANAAEVPAVKALLLAFPGARLTEVRAMAKPVEAVTDFDGAPADDTELWLEE
jgi:DNA polymerase-3 subunit gamma/tau